METRGWSAPVVRSIGKMMADFWEKANNAKTDCSGSDTHWTDKRDTTEMVEGLLVLLKWFGMMMIIQVLFWLSLLGQKED